MKDSKEKEHRISNLKDMIHNVKEDGENGSEYDDIEEDPELIDYLNEDTVDYDQMEIDDEYIYRPGDEDTHAVNLEENPINEDYIIKTPKTEDVDDEDLNDFDDLGDELGGEISENFDNVINAKIRGRSVLAIVSTVVGVIFLIISVYIFQSRSDRVVDNVVAGESSFMFVIFLIFGLLLIIYGIYKLFNVKNPFDNITSNIDSIENDEKDDKKDTAQTPTEKPSPKPIPKSDIPLDKEAYKIGEFDMDEIKTSLKKPASSQKNEHPVFKENIDMEELDDIPPAKEKSSQKKELSEEEIEEMEYEKAKLDNESIDDIFAEVEDIDDIPIISINSEDNKEE